jgi:Domain of unknown function(DUF2779)
MTTFSKSTLQAFQQCPRRLWLRLHAPECATNEVAGFASQGEALGVLARGLLTAAPAVVIDARQTGFEAAREATQVALQARQPVFEALLETQLGAGNKALAFADALLPITVNKRPAWHLIEVKSSTSMNDTQLLDAAIQTQIGRAAGLAIERVSLATVNKHFTLTKLGNYSGLLNLIDQTQAVNHLQSTVADDFNQAQLTAAQTSLPEIKIGRQCSEPHPCEFSEHCLSLVHGKSNHVAPKARDYLPSVQSKQLKAVLTSYPDLPLKKVDDHLLNVRQLRVKQAVLNVTPYFNSAATEAVLAKHTWPLYFLDFESANHIIPPFVGSQPNQKIAFQFSLHRIDEQGKLSHHSFLDLSGQDPRPALAAALIEHCGAGGAVYAYSKSFEAGVIKGLADTYPKLASKLLAISARLVDLLPLTREHYYHPSQGNSWSIKAVLPSIAPTLSYQALSGVQDGTAAMQAYFEATAPACGSERKAAIEDSLLRYCHLDTLAMVLLWGKLAGKDVGHFVNP